MIPQTVDRHFVGGLAPVEQLAHRVARVRRCLFEDCRWLIPVFCWVIMVLNTFFHGGHEGVRVCGMLYLDSEFWEFLLKIGPHVVCVIVYVDHVGDVDVEASEELPRRRC